MMAYSSLLKEGYPIRFTGQDVRRAYLITVMLLSLIRIMEKGFVVDSIAKKETSVDIMIHYYLRKQFLALNGYAATYQGLVIWEAQFGDFANGLGRY